MSSVREPPSGGRFSVIIAHRGGAAILLRALDALAAATSPERDQVILVDNHSGDDSIEQVRRAHPRVLILASPWNLGFARACNQAIAQARTDYVLLLNNDVFVGSDLLDRFEHAFRSFPRLGAVGAQLIAPDGRPLASDRLVPTAWDEIAPRALRRRTPSRPLGWLLEVEAMTGACLAVRSAAIREVGPLDEDFFFYLEDVEWCHRMRTHGWTVACDIDARVTHLVGATARLVPRGAQVEMLRSRLILYRKLMHPAVAAVLEAGRFLSLVGNALLYLFFIGATAGLFSGPRRRFVKYAFLAAWMILAKPVTWGLPDKPLSRAPSAVHVVALRGRARTQSSE